MGDALIDLGFEVYSVLDPDKRGLETTLRDFGRKASEADLVMIFFAGHGVQVNGRNYLVPIDAKLEDPRDLPYDAVPLELFLGAMSEAKVAGITIIDACRDNPFVDRLSARADGSDGSEGRLEPRRRCAQRHDHRHGDPRQRRRRGRHRRAQPLYDGAARRN